MLWLPAGAMGRGVERGAEEMLVPLRCSECQVSRCLGFFFFWLQGVPGSRSPGCSCAGSRTERGTGQP